MRKNILCLWVVLLSLVVGCQKEQLTDIDIFFTADTKGFFAERKTASTGEEVGGYGVLKKFIDSNLTGNSLLVEGGNWFESVPESSVLQGAYLTELAKNLPYSVASVNNKDFEYGWATLKDILSQLPYPFVVSNLKRGGDIPRPFHDYQIRTIAGIKIGFIGFVSQAVGEYTKTKREGFSVEDPISCAQELVDLLKEKGVQYIVALSSIGEGESSGLSNVSLAEEVKGIDLILASGEDKDNASAVKILNTYIVYPHSKLSSVSRVKISFDKDKKLRSWELEDILLKKSQYGIDEEVEKKVEKLKNEIQRKMNKQITKNEEEIPLYQDQESPMGNLLVSCVEQWAKLDGSILNADAISKNVPVGIVSEYDLYNLYPYGDNITFLTIKGHALWTALEKSLNAKNNFPLIAGFEVRYSVDPDENKYIKKIIFNSGKIFQKNATYRIATTDHVLAGGFDHDAFIDSLEFKNTNVPVRQIIRNCFSHYKKLEYSKKNRWEKEGKR